MTETQQKRAEQEWSAISGEPVKVEQIGGTLYAYGSELACLRLEHKFGTCPRIKAGYSTNLETWYFRVEPAA
jgi:hypothetical protein